METLPPGISACTPGKNLTISHRGTGSGEAYSHEGEEFLYLLHGQLEIALEDGETYRLDEGDSFYFESTMQHRWSNPGKKEAWVLWVNTPPTF